MTLCCIICRIGYGSNNGGKWLLVLPGFHSPFLLGIVNSFPRKKLVSLLLEQPQNHDEEDERHPAPEKLLLQITTEAVNLLALGTPDKPADVSLLETGAALTVKAWGLPQELADSSAALIQHQKELLSTASGRAALDFDEWLERNGPVEAADK